MHPTSDDPLQAREEISRGLAEDLLFTEIALRIGRDPSDYLATVASDINDRPRKIHNLVCPLLQLAWACLMCDYAEGIKLTDPDS